MTTTLQLQYKVRRAMGSMWVQGFYISLGVVKY